MTVLRSVTLPGRALLPPARGRSGDARWVTELYRVNGDVTTGGLEVYEPGTSRLVGQYAATTDAEGRFAVTLTDVLPGAYDIKVKGADTLSSLRKGIRLPGDEVDFGELLVGDTNGNDCVNGADVSYMIPAFLSCAPQESYQRYSDTNKDGCVNGTDVSALIPNFLQCGAEAAVAAGAPRPDNRAAGSASLALSLPAEDLQVGDIFTLPLTGDTGSRSADTVDAYLDFDPALLEVVDAQGHLANSIELNTDLFGAATYNRVDNASGQISFSASRYHSPYLPNQFTAATVRFRAKTASRATQVQFVRAGPRWSDLLSFGESLDPSLVSATLAINPATATPVIVAISASGDTARGVVLAWQHTGRNSSYGVWGSTEPYFVPGVPGGRLGTVAAPPWAFAIEQALGDPGVHHFYAVRSYNGQATADSNQVGEFEFRLEPGSVAAGTALGRAWRDWR